MALLTLLHRLPQVGQGSFDIGYAGNAMGTAIGGDMVLVPGVNTLPAVLHFMPTNTAVHDAF